MTFHHHRTAHPAPVPPAACQSGHASRIVAPGGPVSRALSNGRGERERMRAFIADRIEAMIALMDRLDGDPDFEDGHDLEAENEHGGDVQDEPHDPEEDRDDDAILDHRAPRRYPSIDTRKRELICEARMGLDTVRRRKAAASAPAGNLRVVALPLGWR